ncbi:MAG: hypothetical protein WAW23_03685 [Candidatus Methanoperedens sp.]
MESFSLYTILAGGSVVFALIGLIFVIKIWIRWKVMDADVIKARVFLNKKFIERNWLYVFLAGASLTSHQLIKFLTSENYITSVWLTDFSYIVEFLVLILLVMLAYEWYMVLRIKK